MNEKTIFFFLLFTFIRISDLPAKNHIPHMITFGISAGCYPLVGIDHHSWLITDEWPQTSPVISPIARLKSVLRSATGRGLFT